MVVKNRPAMQETWVQSLSGEDPLEEEMATHSNILAWKIPGTEEPSGLQPTGWQRVRHDGACMQRRKSSYQFPWQKKGGYLTDENTETLKMSVVFPKLRHNYLKKQKGKLRFFWHPEVSDPSVPFPMSPLLPKRWVPCSSLHGPLLPQTSSWWECGRVPVFKWAWLQLFLPTASCRSISQNSSVLPEEDDERSCSESETQLSQRPSGQHLGEVIYAPSLLGFGLWVLSFLPAGLFPSICSHSLITPSQHSLSHSKGVTRLILSTKNGACVSHQAWSSVLRIATMGRH